MNYERELKDALAKVLAKNDQLMARVASLETELSKARGDASGSGEIGVAEGARHTSLHRRGYDAGKRIEAAHAHRNDPVRKATNGEIGVFKHPRARGR